MKVCKHYIHSRFTPAELNSLFGKRLVVVMTLKIVIEVPMSNEKCQSKAMRIAASMHRVSSVSIESGAHKMVVMGDGIDPVKLTASLRKKFDYANILIVEEVKPQAAESEKPKPAKPQSVAPDPVIEWHPYYNPYSYHGYPQHYICHGVSDAAPSCWPFLW